MLPHKNFKIRIFRLAENEFHTSRFPEILLTFSLHRNSMTIPGFPVFQVAGHPVTLKRTPDELQSSESKPRNRF